MSKHEPKISFKYIFKYDYNPVYVNGAHGGISPRGEIVANFYLERPPLPNEITHAINPDGSIGAEVIAVDPENLNSSIVRYVSNGVVLNYQNAKVLHGWLGDKIAELERLIQVGDGMPGEAQKN
ncbi:MAG: hypothetical protein A2X82_07570 [Geobacteraceae bacterium GWC2_55_20]|nr:MAG: hypothetical protein A2X82_07570 [Geobacteraceae bacterium GWC2_55_20]OGU18704.1 MAG: hypothetical protein A2X85_01280 [Geobacteraceae bacterium GWF2_54_21]HBA73198.1 hypothetical protein [Geobacter sp.]HCE67583.1 hypothetical protein [Geobacter sp.]